MTRKYNQNAKRDVVNVENAENLIINNASEPIERQKMVLMLLANPEEGEKPRRSKEIKEIRQAKVKAREGEKFKLESRPDINATEVSQEFSASEPLIVDIFGYGNGVEDLFLERVFEGNALTEPKKLQLIASFFQLHSRSVRCVILNGCYLPEQAQEIVQHIDFVLGISYDLQEANTLKFLSNFYFHIFSGRDIKYAYEHGSNCVERGGLQDLHLLPKLFTKRDEKRRRRNEEELAACIRNIKKEPNNPEFWEKKASFLKKLGRAEEMDAAYETASSLAPNAPEKYKIRTQQGRALERLKKPDEAANAYEKALRLDSRDYKVWWSQAKALANAEKYSEASDSYTGAIALEPPKSDNYMIFREYASVLSKLKQYKKSIVLYKESLATEPRY
jgi:Tetratricopeptide repeat